MIDLSNNPASIQKDVPREKIFSAEIIEEFLISKVTWLMTIKPGIRNVTKFVEDRVRMEEIEVLSVQVKAIPENNNYVELLRELHKKIMYPCVVFLEYENKYRVAAWNFIESVKNPNGVVLKFAYISSWIHNPTMSQKGKQLEEKLKDLLLNGEGSIKELYNQICQAIIICVPQYVGSREHFRKLIYDLTGVRKEHPVEYMVDSTKVFAPKNPNAPRFQKKEYSSQFRHFYEYEDIWDAFMHDEIIKSVIEKRRYRNIEELIMYIDMKYEDQDY